MKIDFYLFFSFQLPIFTFHDLKVYLIFFGLEVGVNFLIKFSTKSSLSLNFILATQEVLPILLIFSVVHIWVNMCFIFLLRCYTPSVERLCHSIKNSSTIWGFHIYNSSSNFNEDFSSFNHFSLTTTSAKAIYARAMVCLPRVYGYGFAKKNMIKLYAVE